MTWKLNSFFSFEQYLFLQVFGKSWEIMRHPRYCLAHHLGISTNITNATHFSTWPTPPTVAHEPPYPRWHTTNSLSPIIMNEYFNFQENRRCNLRSDEHLVSRNMHTVYFGTDTITSLGPKLWKLITDKINMPQHYQLLEPRLNLGPSTTAM